MEIHGSRGSEPKMIRLLSYTTSPVTAVGLSTVFSDATDIDHQVVSSGVDQFSATVAELQPDVVLVESSPEIHIGALAGLRRKAPSTRIVLWVQGISLEMAHALREIGVCGVLRKNVTLELTIRCIRQVAGGEIWFERSLINEFIGKRKVKLSRRERQLVALISQGYGNSHIAGSLSLSEGTVRVYLSKLFKKVGVSDRYELAMYGLRSMAMINADTDDSDSPHELWSSTLFVRDNAGIQA